MAIGGHPDHGMGGVASQGSAGTGMESAFGGAAIGVPGGAPAGQNEMGAFLDAMTQRYGPQSVKNFVDNYLNRHFNQRTLGQPLGIPAQGYRDQKFGAQTTPLGIRSNVSSVSPELEMSGRMTPAQLAQLEQNFEAYADPSVLADAMPAPNYGPAYGGGGDYRRRYMSDI
jgi:hypothetical protein